MPAQDPILTFFSFLFIIFFISTIVMQIYYCARKRMNKSKKILYVDFAFSILAAAVLTIYTAWFVQGIHEIGAIVVAFILNLVLWISPVIIAALIYWIYSWKNNQIPKEETKNKTEETPKNMSSSIYGKNLKKE